MRTRCSGCTEPSEKRKPIRIDTTTTQAEPKENGTLKKSLWDLWGHSFILLYYIICVQLKPVNVNVYILIVLQALSPIGLLQGLDIFGIVNIDYVTKNMGPGVIRRTQIITLVHTGHPSFCVLVKCTGCNALLRYSVSNPFSYVTCSQVGYCESPH